MARIEMDGYEADWRGLAGAIDLAGDLAGGRAAAVLGLEYHGTDPWDLCANPEENALLVSSSELDGVVPGQSIEVVYGFDPASLAGRVTQESKAAAVLSTMLTEFALEHATDVTLGFPGGGMVVIPVLGPGTRIAYELARVARDLHETPLPRALDYLVLNAVQHPTAIAHLDQFRAQHRHMLTSPAFEQVIDCAATVFDDPSAGPRLAALADDGDGWLIGTELAINDARRVLHRLGEALLGRPARRPSAARQVDLGFEPPSLN